MQIEFGNNFYELISWDKDYVQIQGSASPYRIYAPPYYDIVSLKQYIHLHPPQGNIQELPYVYLDHPYHLFKKPYLVKIYHASATATVELTTTSLCVTQRPNVNTMKLLHHWKQRHLYNELTKLIAYWEEQLDNYNVTEIRISSSMKTYYSIRGSKISFSQRLIDLDREQVNLIILMAFCKFSKKTKQASEAIFNLYIPRWREIVPQ